MRWFSFGFISARSAISIIISTCKNVYDTFITDQLTLRPPDENALSNLETFLQERNALEYFYDYLKEEDDNERKEIMMHLQQENALHIVTDYSVDHQGESSQRKNSKAQSSFECNITSDVPRNVSIEEGSKMLPVPS